MPITLSELARRTGAAVAGDGDVAVSRVATLDAAGPGTITFVTHRRFRAKLAATGASAVIVEPGLADATPLPKLVSANPYATYAKVATILHPPEPVAAGIHPSAVVDDAASVAPTAAIGPHAVVGPRAVVGARARIGAGCVVGADAAIGEDTLLHPNVTVYDRCIVGPRCILHAGVVIGADGFGMAEEKGRWLKIPQVGRVVIGADVEIGANTTVDRGAIDDTVIEDDVKLDNQIQVGHNCRIGAHTAIAGCTGIAGSTIIGKNCRIGGAAMFAGHLELCDGVVITGGTGVGHSITEPGVYASGWPAIPMARWRHVLKGAWRLQELERRLRELEGGKASPAAGAGEGGDEH